MVNDGASAEKRVLLVEGQDDDHVVRHLCRFDSRIPTFCIHNKAGIDSLLRGVRAEILAEGRTSIGILVDANDDLEARWRAVTDRIRSAGIQPPLSPTLGGTIMDVSPRVGIWLMPDNNSPGEIEDFIAMMIPCNDAVWPLSETYIDSIPVTHRKFREGKILRSKVHAWLAAREAPRRMGSAIGAGDLNVDVELSKKFVSWLRVLFQ